MTYFGKIKSYDRALGAGMIIPDKGGDPLPFGRSDLQQQETAPSPDQIFVYETSEVTGGAMRAVRPQPKQGDGPSLQEQQARAQRG